MTDRELLELAAKAAGFKRATYESWSGMDIRYGFDFAIFTGDEYWNPLADDGDALRLAVALQLTVNNEHINAGVAYCTRGDDGFPYVRSGTSADTTILPSDYAATRRAIVMAAAEIGKSMP